MTTKWHKNIIGKIKNFGKKISIIEDNVLDERKRFKNIFERNHANKSLLTLKHIWSTVNSAEPLSEVLSTVINGLSDELGYLYCFVFQIYKFESGVRLKIRAANENNFSAKMHNILQNSIFSYDIPYDNEKNIIVQAIEKGEIANTKSFKALFEGSVPEIEEEKLQTIDNLRQQSNINIANNSAG